MKSRVIKGAYGLGLVVALLGLSAKPASAQAVITNGFGVALGVNPEGHLNTADRTGAVNPYNSSPYVGVAYFTDYGPGVGSAWGDATAPGCLCEGWGVAATDSSAVTHAGYANISSDFGVNNLVLDSFTSTASTAVSSVHLADLTGLLISQDYHPSASNALFEDVVTITNSTGGDLSNLLYRRVMDWDVPPTTFSELVTIQGNGLGNLSESCDNGFWTANPTVACSSPYFLNNADGVDTGPADHGALFTFNFGTLAAGASKSFSIFYGAAPTESAAFAALATAGAEGIYSFGQSAGNGATGVPATFIFGFGGVGAPPIEGSPVPEPASLLLLGTGLAGLARFRKGKKQA